MRDGKKVVITYGTYDLLHFGHIRLLERAKALGDYLIVGITSDAFDRDRGKLNVYQPLSDRMDAVLKTGIPDQIVVEEFPGQKISDIQKYGVDIFAIGSDWDGKFDYLKKYCDVVYLERTQGVSSTELRADKIKPISFGCIGANYFSERIVRESAHVSNFDAVGICSLNGNSAIDIADTLGIAALDCPSSVFDSADAVYIAASIERREELIREALDSGKHVLCEGAIALSQQSGIELFELAKERRLVLMEAMKTLYFPAFVHLRLLLQSGIIGEVKDIRASNSHVTEGIDRSDMFQGSFYNLAPYLTLAPFSIFGNDYTDASFACSYDGDFCTWAKLDLLYPTGTATLYAGQGIKTESDMVITGTDGYIYVPSPWWKTEYFEVRGEDLRNTRKFYYEYVGTGQRYELFEFQRRINSGSDGYPPIHREEDSLATIKLIERFHAGDTTVLGQGKYSFGGGERITDR